ncbi:carbohydrate ABC transporter permease [Mahella australiensis]|uniref:Binding-protein-dependent transport systems inner membrane component n=1 Tax=Mahella australiensis (strain DSM 15567 / CIP 107919 / 50-1 BON) TaxID=697281 RepID=F4A331_MAHA5|nr:carbohydrate ABC transporter permease [Mahella australiensis]AEE95246.1 binding-protein-dependent transport systems inner membrane component [Mahella australiensis 50-1 BON]
MVVTGNTIKARHHIKFSFGWLVVYIFMIALVAFTALPIIYMIATAFKPLDELFIYPPRFFVRRPTFQNFSDLLTAMDSSVVPFTRYIYNSTITTAAIVAGTVIISSMGAFALVKYKLPLADWIFNIVIAALMFSPQVTQIPTYMVISGLNMVNTYWALIIPKLAVAYNFFLMKQFMEQIPDTLLEAARIDGATEWTIFWRIVMPMARPAWATLVVFSFVSNWNDYFTPLIFITSQAMKTLPLALQTIAGGPGVVARSGAMAAATFLTTVPTIVLFVFMQSKVMQTMAYSGIKA